MCSWYHLQCLCARFYLFFRLLLTYIGKLYLSLKTVRANNFFLSALACEPIGSIIRFICVKVCIISYILPPRSYRYLSQYVHIHNCNLVFYTDEYCFVVYFSFKILIRTKLSFFFCGHCAYWCGAFTFISAVNIRSCSSYSCLLIKQITHPS